MLRLFLGIMLIATLGVGYFLYVSLSPSTLPTENDEPSVEMLGSADYMAMISQDAFPKKVSETITLTDIDLNDGEDVLVATAVIETDDLDLAIDLLARFFIPDIPIPDYGVQGNLPDELEELRRAGAQVQRRYHPDCGIPGALLINGNPLQIRIKNSTGQTLALTTLERIACEIGIRPEPTEENPNAPDPTIIAE